MRKLLLILILVLLSLCVGNVCATTYEISPQKHHEVTFSDLREGDIIPWEWHVVTSGQSIDFWIEDSSGNRFMYMDDRTNSTDSFKVTHDGTWRAKWFNDNLFLPVTIEYEISVLKTSDLNWIFLLIICIVIIIGISRVFSNSKIY